MPGRPGRHIAPVSPGDVGRSEIPTAGGQGPCIVYTDPRGDPDPAFWPPPRRPGNERAKLKDHFLSNTFFQTLRRRISPSPLGEPAPLPTLPLDQPAPCLPLLRDGLPQTASY